MEQVKLTDSGAVGKCERCGDPCKVAPQKNPDARMLRASTVPQGYCVNCSVAEFFYVTGSRAICPDPSSLRLKPIQEQFTRVMVAGKADAKPLEINWGHVIAHWDLPFRAGKKKTVDPREDGGDPTRALMMADRAQRRRR
jgi:hypothetical protein